MGGNRLQRLDDLRGVAAVLVLVCHATLFTRDPGDGLAPAQVQFLGSFGVAIFFVVSGLVIYRPFIRARAAGSQIDLGAYAVRRVARIAPAYWFALAFFALLLPAQVWQLRDPVLTLRFALFGQIYSADTYTAALAPAWSLCVEMTFYVLAPLIALSVRRCAGFEPWLLLAFCVMQVTIVMADATGLLAGTIFGYIGWFAIGMALARLSCRPGLRNARIPARWFWAFAACAYAVVVGHLTHPVMTSVSLGLLGGVTVLAAVVCPGKARLRWLGDRSYGVYLWHYPIFGWLVEKDVGVVPYAITGTLLTITAAHLSFRYVERPLIRRATAFSRQRKPRLVVVPPVAVPAGAQH